MSCVAFDVMWQCLFQAASVQMFVSGLLLNIILEMSDVTLVSFSCVMFRDAILQTR